MKIMTAHTNFEIEPLRHPFGFKGGALTNLWQYSVYLETECGLTATGVGNQNTLWSDATLFAAHSQSASAAMMYLITEHAAKLMQGMTLETPKACLDVILPALTAYAKSVTGLPTLRETFVLNALVGIDHALWQLYAKKVAASGLDDIIPSGARNALSHRYDRLALIPLISYGVSTEEARQLAEDGYFFLKIKIGSDPEHDGDPEKMLRWDMERIAAIHAAVSHIKTPYTEHGHIAYYLDANGRYDTKERLRTLLNFADSIGALSRVVLLEEPFAEENKCSVHDLPVLIAADESAHSARDVAERIALGYGAIALKPIAKTMSVTYDMIAEAHKHHVPCFCADLTVGPLLLEINKSFAARLACLPGLLLPVVEGNGFQNYSHYARMEGYSPTNGLPFTQLKQGGYTLDALFYERSGGIFDESAHYRALSLEGAI